MDLMPLKVVVLLSVLGHCLSQKGELAIDLMDSHIYSGYYFESHKFDHYGNCIVRPMFIHKKIM